MDIFDRDTQEYVINTGRPILLVGEHGVGKTSVLRSMSTTFGLKMHELNAATLDSFVHIVGLPVIHEGKLTMDPPDALMSAEMLFIDEINRADRPSRNALFEIICDKSVNGLKLPSLKIVVAAMNPPDGEYQVDALDIALEDRFLHTFEIKRDISFALDKVADPDQKAAIKQWYECLETPPSPRRLTWTIESAMKDGIVNEEALLNALDNKLYGTKSLIQMLAGNFGVAAPGADHLLSESEKLTAAKVIYSAIACPEWKTITDRAVITTKLAKMFVVDNKNTLPTPMADFNQEDEENIDKSQAIKDLISMFPFDFTQADTWGDSSIDTLLGTAPFEWTP